MRVFEIWSQRKYFIILKISAASHMDREIHRKSVIIA